MYARLPDRVGRRGRRKPRPALRSLPEPRFESSPKPLLKSRYRIREIGGVRFLTCVEAPTLRVRIESGVTATAQEARAAPPGTIFLDGAAQAAPFADPVRRIYNLDHHEGCVRSFTLSACEQAMVLVRKGLDLRSREWTIRVNDADLDAVLAIWVLLNHLRLSDPNDPVRNEIMPLLRLEGAIDAQGLDLQDLCALPPALLEETRRRMDRLRDHERHLKASHRWQRVDPVEYVRERLAQIDSLVYSTTIFDDLVDIEELGRTEIGDGSVALACRTRSGIYEVERELRRLHGPQLGLIVLEQRPGVYTLRQVNPSLSAELDAVYAHLNLVDANAGSASSGNRWGGSGEIGGSPRSSGSKLSTSQVLDVCRHAFAPVSAGRRLRGLVRAVSTTVFVVLAAVGVAGAAGPDSRPRVPRGLRDRVRRDLKPRVPAGGGSVALSLRAALPARQELASRVAARRGGCTGRRLRARESKCRRGEPVARARGGAALAGRHRRHGALVSRTRARPARLGLRSGADLESEFTQRKSRVAQSRGPVGASEHRSRDGSRDLGAAAGRPPGDAGSDAASVRRLPDRRAGGGTRP